MTRKLSALVAVSVAALLLIGIVAFLPRSSLTAVAIARRGDLTVLLRDSGVLKPAQSVTYRSQILGREAEILFLAAEGIEVETGDLLIRLDATDLSAELARAEDLQGQALVELRIAEADLKDAQAELRALADGHASVAGTEVRLAAELAERKARRARDELNGLKPLLDRGYVTREEFDRAALQLEEADQAARLARQKADVFETKTRPRDAEKAALAVSRREAQVENGRARCAEASARIAALREAIASASIYARRPGLVIYEENLATSPRRKVRIGDRVTASHGLITIPEVKRMLAETSIREVDLYRVKSGQAARIGLDAYPAVSLTGRVSAVGTFARVFPDRPADGKRFDVTIEVDSTQVDLRPEMSARVEIIVAERKGVLLIPINAVFDRGGARTVYVVTSRGIEKRSVELGESDDVDVEVLKGVQEGEQLRLTDPDSSSSGLLPAVEPTFGFARRIW